MAIDWSRGRLYIPQDELRHAGLTEAALDRALQARQAEPALRALIEAQTRRAWALLESGAPLVSRVPWRLSLELRAVMAGPAHRREDRARRFDPFAQRPALGAGCSSPASRLSSRPRW
jgi:phytoene/squalene synthetase